MSRLFALAALFSLVAALTVLAAPRNAVRLVEAEGGFSYTPPKGWRIFTIPGLKYKVAAGTPAKGFAPNINVVDDAFSGTIEEYGKASLTGLEQAVTQFKILGQKSFTTASGLKGVKLATQGMQQDRLLRQLYFLLPGKDDRKYVVTFSCIAEAGTKYDAQVDAAIKTFTLK